MRFRNDLRLGCVLLFLVALAGGCKKSPESPTGPSPAPGPAAQTVFYTALGASDALGAGGSVVCAPFDLDCRNGSGYIQQIRRRLEDTGRTVTYRNLGMPGAVLSKAVQDVGASVGRTVLVNFIDHQAPFVPRETTHVTIFAGGNDANVILQGVRDGRPADPRAFIDQQIRQWGNDYATLVQRVRDRAPSARIVVANLPNLGVAPYMSGTSTTERAVMQYIAVGLADQANALTSRNVLVVDLMCEPRIYSPSNFSSDGFHPSDSGYKLMADLIYPALVDGSAGAPSGSCPQRSVYPSF